MACACPALTPPLTARTDVPHAASRSTTQKFVEETLAPSLQPAPESTGHPTVAMEQLLPAEAFANDCWKALETIKSSHDQREQQSGSFLAHASQDLISRHFSTDREAAEAFCTCAQSLLSLFPQGSPSCSAVVARVRLAEGVRAFVACLREHPNSGNVAENAMFVLDRLASTSSADEAARMSDCFTSIGGVGAIVEAMNRHSTPTIQLARPAPGLLTSPLC